MLFRGLRGGGRRDRVLGLVVVITICIVALVKLNKSPDTDNFKIEERREELASRTLHKDETRKADLQSLSDGKLNCQKWNVLESDKKANVLSNYDIKPPNNSALEEDHERRKESFVKIFEKKTWAGQKASDKETIIGSGPGSTIAMAKNVTKTLDVVITQLKTWLGKSSIKMLDIPCGDLMWMSKFIKDRTDVEYVGMEIVPAIVEHHQKIYSPKYPHMTFVNQDIVAQPLNVEFDLIFTRQMTQHLTSADTLKVFRHFIDSQSHFLLATTVPDVGERELVNLGGIRHRFQNLQLKPYSLPPPICISRDNQQAYNALWQLR